MFTKILIANRGEIACRIMRTARALGVECVAVYSEADHRALHVHMADEAQCIGSALAAESYLNGEKIIQVAVDSGAQAIHPGYGFLSENPDFVEAVGKVGLTFIGPSADAIRAMGLKDAAKKLMEEAGVPVVPGYHGEEQDGAFLAKRAEEIGYPVLIKARAGGGGKGMRRVDSPQEFSAALAGAQREGLASFGDGHVLIEKYIQAPRHIEVQVFGDSHGNVVHLFERDCSLQRRHQKVIEEAPAPGMTDPMRQAMTDAAVRAAQAIGYAGAGTVEFIVDGSDGLHPDRFWFMEMNTRLQVEHPVTEAITGVDLVEWQLRVAAGEPLPAEQEALRIHGHAFEARLYAEDVGKGFLPATGNLDWLVFSQMGRIDTGVQAGDSISPYYDPMIAKLISTGENRKTALRNLHRMLAETQLAGLTTNQQFLMALTAHSGFSEGHVDTGLIERDLVPLTAPPEMGDELVAAAAMTAMDLPVSAATPSGHLPSEDPFDGIKGYSHWHARMQYVQFADTDGVWAVKVSFDADTGVWRAAISRNGEAYGAWIEDPRARQNQLYYGIERLDESIFVFARAGTFELAIHNPLQSADAVLSGSDTISSPMPGLVKVLNGRVGQAVEQGAVIAVLEAMKMEHSLAAPRDGTIEAVFIKQGDQVDEGAILVSLVAEEE